ncbi:MAG: hypothetical protein NZ516_09955 [Raineya sp.]|nr:hypothetical protein [Raineya sp.]
MRTKETLLNVLSSEAGSVLVADEYTHTRKPSFSYNSFRRRFTLIRPVILMTFTCVNV